MRIVPPREFERLATMRGFRLADAVEYRAEPELQNEKGRNTRLAAARQVKLGGTWRRAGTGEFMQDDF